ncbi:MAG: DUF4339 domain-containing protein [Bacteriovoracaceae bacterium]|nr:DUF4339 domain-containing protein [Bacteriovoracaceae bacterium]
MSNNWFVFKDGHHLGPYVPEELHMMYQYGKVSGTTLIWREGKENWRPLQDCPEIFDALELEESQKTTKPAITDDPPPLVEKPVSEEQKSKIPPIPKLPASIDVKTPTLPEPAKPSEPKEEKGGAALIKEVEEVIKAEILDPSKKPIFSIILSSLQENLINISKWIYGSLVFILIMFSIYFIWGTQANDPLKGEVLTRDYNRLKEISTSSYKSRPEFAFALSSKARGIWGATNWPGSGEVQVTLESIKGRTLSNKKIVIKSVGYLEDKNVLFSNLLLNQGDRVIEGYYKVLISAIDLSLSAKISRYLSKPNTFRPISKLFSNYGQFKHTTQTLLTKSTPFKFEKILAKYQERINKKHLKFVNDLLEKYRTYQALLKKTEESFRKTLKKISRGKQISRFEKSYISNIAPVLQGAALDSQKVHILTQLNKTTFVAKQNLDNFKLGKDIALIISDMIRKTKKQKRLNKKTKKALLREFKTRAQIARNYCLKKVDELTVYTQKYDEISTI